MKRGMQVWVMMGMLWVSAFAAAAQSKTDDQRMDQDIEVAENILSTLFRQKYDRRNFFPMEINGSYLSGYGVTFRVPQHGFGGVWGVNVDAARVINFSQGTGTSYSYSYRSSDSDDEKAMREAEVARTRAEVNKTKSESAKAKAEQDMKTTTGQNRKSPPARVQGWAAATGEAVYLNADSVGEVLEKQFIEVAKSFIADYGDVLSQLKPEEKIVITNRMDEFGGNYTFKWGREARRGLISVEGKRDDIGQFKTGKISRDQLMSRLTVINTETTEKLDPDLEVLSSMFGRLYREDLSRTYYTQGDIPYDRMKDYGVIYYMRVYSSNEEGVERWSMPTVRMNNVSQEERDKKVKELYPAFENDLKENIVEYGRTLRSLKDDEQVILNVKLTKCTGCAIPASIEVSVKFSALKDYASGKASREATLAKVNVKKVGNQ